MSSQSVSLNTNKQLIANTDLSKVFIGDNRYQDGNMLNNSSYNDLALLAGTVVGRIAATGKLVPYVHTANDGSQYPVGLLAQDIEMDSGETKNNVTIVDFGDVAEGQVKFLDGSATTLASLATNAGGRSVKDLLQAQGIKIVPTTEMTGYDNQ